MLLDEPFGALDLQIRRRVDARKFSNQLWERFLASPALLITHDWKSVADARGSTFMAPGPGPDVTHRGGHP